MYIALLLLVALLAAGGVYVYHDEVDALVKKVRAKFDA